MAKGTKKAGAAKTAAKAKPAAKAAPASPVTAPEVVRLQQISLEIEQTTYGLKEVAQVLGLSDMYARNRAKAGRIPGAIVAGEWRFPIALIDQLAANGGVRRQTSNKLAEPAEDEDEEVEVEDEDELDEEDVAGEELEEAADEETIEGGDEDEGDEPRKLRRPSASALVE